MTIKKFALYCMVLCFLCDALTASTKFTLPKCCRKRRCNAPKMYTCLFGAGPQKVACVQPREDLSHIDKFWGELCPKTTKLLCRMLDRDYVCGCAIVRRRNKHGNHQAQKGKQHGSGISQRPE
uniref:Basic tail secreted protein n=1 Tax=Rhipicephalus appendiculatus TaxID=34631 RepID=A0A131YD36_RHIAP